MREKSVVVVLVDGIHSGYVYIDVVLKSARGYYAFVVALAYTSWFAGASWSSG